MLLADAFCKVKYSETVRRINVKYRRIVLLHVRGTIDTTVLVQSK